MEEAVNALPEQAAFNFVSNKNLKILLIIVVLIALSEDMDRHIRSVSFTLDTVKKTLSTISFTISNLREILEYKPDSNPEEVN